MGEESELFRGLPEPEQVRRRTMRAMQNGLHLSTTALLAEDGRGGWVLRMIAGAGLDRSVHEGAPITDLGAAASVPKTRKAMLLNPDRPMAMRVPYQSRAVELAGAMAMPVGAGLLWADRRDEPFSDQEFESFQDAAQGFEELAIVHDRLRLAVGQVTDLTETVEGARAILEASSERECVKVLADAAIRQSRARTALVVLLGPTADDGVVVAGAGVVARDLIGTAVSASDGLVGLALRSGIAVPTNLRFLSNTDAVVGTSNLGLTPGEGVLVHPLGAPEPIGALVLAHGEFDRPGLIHGVRTLCDCTALLVKQFRLRDLVAHDAMMDGLSGLYNRRAILSRLVEAVASAVRHGTELSLLMLDADHFKRVNDRHGHQAGDRVLQFISETIRRNLRESDAAGRYGGEEFAVMLPHTPLLGAVTVAERIRSFCEASGIPLSSGSVTVTVSIGVASVGPGCKRADDLVAAADAALYEAKRAGRNQVKARQT
jgi:diguanylate cyclase (GGDEF)-like protein